MPDYNTYPGMAPLGDWGLSDALRGRDDFSQYRQDAQNNLLLQSQMAQMADQKRKEEAAAQQGLMDALGKASQADVLPTDKKKIIDWEAEQRKPVTEGIYKANGDMGRFYAMGGRQLMNDYNNNLTGKLNDKGLNPIAVGLANKHASAIYQNAKDHGLDIGPIGHDANGQEIPYEQAMADHAAGKIDVLPMPETAAPIQSDNFEGDRGRLGPDPTKPYQYTTKDLLPGLINTTGAKPWQAQRLVSKYLTGQKDAQGNPLTSVYSNSTPIDPIEQQKKQADIAHVRAETAKLMQADNKFGFGVSSKNAQDGEEYLKTLGAVKNGDEAYFRTEPVVITTGEGKNKKTEKFDMPISHTFDGSIVGKYESEPDNKGKTTIKDLVIEGVAYNKSTGDIFAKYNNSPDWHHINDIHHELGLPYLDKVYKQGGAKETVDAAKEVASKKYHDPFQNGHPDYSKYYNLQQNVDQPTGKIAPGQ